jgi:hypothetical protein
VRPNPPHAVADASKALSRLAARPPLRTRQNKNGAGSVDPTPRILSPYYPESQIDVVLPIQESMDFARGLKMQRSFASLRMTAGRVETSKLYIAAGMSDLRLKLPKDLGKILALRRR